MYDNMFPPVNECLLYIRPLNIYLYDDIDDVIINILRNFYVPNNKIIDVQIYGDYAYVLYKKPVTKKYFKNSMNITVKYAFNNKFECSNLTENTPFIKNIILNGYNFENLSDGLYNAVKKYEKNINDTNYEKYICNSDNYCRLCDDNYVNVKVNCTCFLPSLCYLCLVNSILKYDDNDINSKCPLCDEIFELKSIEKIIQSNSIEI
jgi:hypothetical protein